MSLSPDRGAENGLDVRRGRWLIGQTNLATIRAAGFALSRRGIFPPASGRRTPPAGRRKGAPTMGRTKAKLHSGQCALGAWMMIGHPAIAELMAGEGFDWLAVDMEHTQISRAELEDIERAVRPSGADLLVRLDAVNPLLAKHVLDAGARGVIVPSVMRPEDVDAMVAAVKYPPVGQRGTSLCRATDFGRNFADYTRAHNDEVIVVVMIEHIEAARQAEAILSRPGIDAAFIGPYDLSASMGLSGQLDHPDVLAAEAKILAACRECNVAPGYHVVPPDPKLLQRRIELGYRFLGCSIDTQFIMQGSRNLLKEVKETCLS